MSYQIVPLTENWLSDLLELEKQCFLAPWTKAMFHGELANDAAVYRLVLCEDKPVAYMGMWCVADEGQITNIAVSPAHRRRGLAEGLLRLFINMENY